MIDSEGTEAGARRTPLNPSGIRFEFVQAEARLHKGSDLRDYRRRTDDEVTPGVKARGFSG